jgi:hypothetical protein
MAAAEADPEDGLVGWDWTEEDWRPAGKLSHRCSIGTQRYDVYADASRNWLIGFSIIDDRRRHPASSTSNASSLPIHPLLLIDDPLPSATISLPSSLPHRSVVHANDPPERKYRQPQLGWCGAYTFPATTITVSSAISVEPGQSAGRQVVGRDTRAERENRESMFLWELGPGVTTRGEESRAVDG